MKTTTSTQETDDAMAAMARIFPTAMGYALRKPITDVAAVYAGSCPESMARHGHFWIVQGKAFNRCTNRTGCRSEERARRCGDLLARRWGYSPIHPERAR